MQWIIAYIRQVDAEMMNFYIFVALGAVDRFYHSSHICIENLVYASNFIYYLYVFFEFLLLFAKIVINVPFFHEHQGRIFTKQYYSYLFYIWFGFSLICTWLLWKLLFGFQ